MVRDVFDPSVVSAWFSRSGPTLGVSRSGIVIAQAVALAAMAYCYFLAPQFAWGYAIVAVSGFLTFAVPAMASGPRGVSGQRLIDSSPGRQHLPGGVRYAIRLAATILICFAFPAAVAAILPSPISERSTHPWVALVCLVGTAGATVAAVGIVGPRRSGLVSLVAVAAAVAILTAALSLPVLPLLRGLPGFRPT